MGALRDAHTVVTRMASQLEGLGIQATNVEAAALGCATSSSSAWRGCRTWRATWRRSASPIAAEGKLLQEQEQRLEASRQKVRGFNGYSTLGADQSHAVLKPLAACANSTDEEAIAPSLEELKDPFVARLQRAEREAGETLDRLLVDKGEVTQLTQQVDLGLHNRELNSEGVRALAQVESRLALVQQETVCGSVRTATMAMTPSSKTLSSRSGAGICWRLRLATMSSPLGAERTPASMKPPNDASPDSWMNRKRAAGGRRRER